MEICKRPTFQNILTAQGIYTSKNSDNVLQHKIQNYQKYTFTYFITHARSTHTQTGTHAACTHQYRQVNRK